MSCSSTIQGIPHTFLILIIFLDTSLPVEELLGHYYLATRDTVLSAFNCLGFLCLCLMLSQVKSILKKKPAEDIHCGFIYLPYIPLKTSYCLTDVQFCHNMLNSTCLCEGFASGVWVLNASLFSKLSQMQKSRCHVYVSNEWYVTKRSAMLIFIENIYYMLNSI